MLFLLDLQIIMKYFEYLLDNGCEFDIELAKSYGIMFTEEDKGENHIDDNGEVYELYKRRKSL